MQTRRDQLQAYRFVTRRVMAALLHGEPDTPESPMRRLAVATFAGTMVAVVAVAAFGVWGLLRPSGSASVTDAGTLLVEKETGARYVYNSDQRLLYPVLNYTSARLLLDSDSVTVRQVSRRALASFRRGPTVGIPGAPDSLPGQDSLVQRPWTVCSSRRPAQDARTRTVVSLLAGRDVHGRPLGDGQALVVATPAGRYWVVWHDERLATDRVGVSIFSVDIRDVPVVREAWLDALPAGPDLRHPAVRGLGTPAAFRLEGRTPVVGQVFRADIVGSEPKFYVALRDGLAPILETEASLMQADASTRIAYGGSQVRILPVDAAAAAAQVSASSVSDGALPRTPPSVVTLPDGGATPLCAAYPDPRGEPATVDVTVGGDLPPPDTGQTGSPDLASVVDQGAADRLVLPAGGGALAGLVPGPDRADEVQSYYLIAGNGLKYPIASPDLVAKLGYRTADAVPLPPNLLRLLPDGPVLSADKVRQPVNVAPSPQDTSTPTASN